MNDIIASIVALAGGRLVGRTRLQKSIFLLDARGLSSGATYYYHNFGPFSDEVVDAISDAKFSGEVTERIAYRQSDGSPFSIFETIRPADEVGDLGELPHAEAKVLVSKLAEVNSTVLELAATIYWLREFEEVDDWRDELVRRKGPKTAGNRIVQAEALLNEFGLGA